MKSKQHSHFPYWLDPYRMKTVRKIDLHKDCHSCKHKGAAKLDERQLIRCMYCLDNHSRPCWEGN